MQLANIFKDHRIFPKLINPILQDCKVHLISENEYLLATTVEVPVTIQCNKINVQTHNSLPKCHRLASTSIYQLHWFKNPMYKRIYFSRQQRYPDAAEQLVNNEKLLNPLKIHKMNLKELNIAEQKLNEYSDQINKIINRIFNKR